MPSRSYTLVSAPSKLTNASPLRLEGDDLYAWAQLVSEWQRITQTKQTVAIQFMQQRGFTPGEYLLTDDGYIISQEEAHGLSRIQTLPARDSRPVQDAAPQTPGSAIPKEDRHTHAQGDS